jgi:hypothetical protein
MLAFPVSRALPAPDSTRTLPASLNERIEIMTDRSIYGVWERILFAGERLLPPALDTLSWSKVLYLELLTPGGTSVARGKYPIQGSRSSGYLNIPADLLTGNYYLAAYTKWMRNFSPEDFHYRLVRIINPFTPQLETSAAGNGKGSTREWERKPLEESIICSTDKESYGPRERVELTLSLPGIPGSLSHMYSLTVIRKDPFDTLDNLKIVPEDVRQNGQPGILYLPENHGLSLSGSIVSRDSSAPVPADLVSLAILGRKPGYRVSPTGPGGSFCFALDSMTGSRDMYISSNHDDRNFEIRIDNDFANPAVRFRELPWAFPEAEKDLAREIIFNMQVSRHFPATEGRMTVQDGGGRDQAVTAFYGTPSSSVNIDEFIELPTLKEVLIELVPGVFPRMRNNEPYLLFSGNKLTSILINRYAPLVMVDHVQVENLGGLLLMSPKKIRKVELLNEIYIIGNTTYGGILNVITKKGDMAGIDLPENSFFFDFTSFKPQVEPVFRRHAGSAFDRENPDYRNCLYWSPKIRIDPGRETALDFYTSDNKGEYRVLIRGFSADGSILQGKCDFLVE